MLSGIRKQRDILITLNDEIENGINQLKNISSEMKKSKDKQNESSDFLKQYDLEMPRVKRLQKSLHDSVVNLEKMKFNSTNDIINLKEQISDYQRDLNETKPTLARFVWL